jgi:hypothetical protein
MRERKMPPEKAEKLLRAFGEIDSRFVREADPEVKAGDSADERQTTVGDSAESRPTPAWASGSRLSDSGEAVPAGRPFRSARIAAGFAAAITVMAVAGGLIFQRKGALSEAISAESPQIAADPRAAEIPEAASPKMASSEAAEGNPFVDYTSLADAEAAAGFSFTAPENVGDGKAAGFRVMDGILIEVIYRNPDGEETCRVRKERIPEGQAAEDISGNYTQYDMAKTEQADGITYSLSGDGDTISKVTWADGGYAYAIDCAEPLTESDAMRLAGELGGKEESGQ